MAVEEIASHVHPAGRGRVGFPFNTITIAFVVPTAANRAHLEAICDGPPDIEARICRRLGSAGLEDADVDVTVAFVAESDPSWSRPESHVSLGRVAKAERLRRGPSVRIEIEVTRGICDRASYVFTGLPVTIGRGADVRDSQHQLLRINQVAFIEEGDDAAKTVSRRHARIELDPHTDRLRVVDDNSAQGTSIVRNGCGRAVPRGSHGLAIQDGDEIALGQARLKIRILGCGT